MTVGELIQSLKEESGGDMNSRVLLADSAVSTMEILSIYQDKHGFIWIDIEEVGSLR